MYTNFHFSIENLFLLLCIQSALITPLSNTPAGRRFFGGFLMGGLSVGPVIKFLDGVQQSWVGQCEIDGGVGLSCGRHDMQ